MTYGIQTTRVGGSETINQTMPGGRVFVGVINRAVDSTGGVVTTYTYPDVPGGSNLRVLQLDAGSHSWTTGTNGSGQATITLTSYTPRYSYISADGPTVLYVFTTQTTEPNFGIQTTNDVGERTVSSLFPCPEFLGKVTFSSTPTYSEDLLEGSYWRYTHDASSSLGASRTRLILWNLPENTGDCWFSGTSLVSSSVSGSYTISATYICPPGTPYAMPEAFVFALDGLAASSDGYGVRVYNSSGALTFDAGLNHMIIKGYENTVDYPTSTGTTNTYSSLSTLSNLPVFLIPSFSKEVWTSSGSSYKIEYEWFSRGFYYQGGMRRVGNTLYTRLVKTNTLFEDYAFGGGTFTYGVNTDLLQLVVDGATYGATAAALAMTLTAAGGTSACTFDGAGTNNTYTCVSSSNWTANWAGGNGNAITYTWSIVSNAGGLSISSGGSSATCTVSKTGTAPTSASTTYSCTLRCTISQSGSSSVYIDVGVTHTHTDTWSDPGGGGY